MKTLNDILSADATEHLIAFRRALDRALPGAVETVLLFGSRARGEARADSDYDLAVLLHGKLAARADVRARIADEAFEHMIDGYSLTPVALRGDYLTPIGGRYRTELARRIAQDGVQVV